MNLAEMPPACQMLTAAADILYLQGSMQRHPHLQLHYSIAARGRGRLQLALDQALQIEVVRPHHIQLQHGHLRIGPK